MFGQRTSAAGTDLGKERFATIVGEHTAIKGDLVLSGGIRIDGQLEGNISGGPDGHVSAVVGQTGKVTGNITANRVVIAGTVRGNVQADDEVELQATAVLEGEVQCKSLRVAHGARLMCRILTAEQPAGTPRPVLVTDHGEAIKVASKEG